MALALIHSVGILYHTGVKPQPAGTPCCHSRILATRGSVTLPYRPQPYRECTVRKALPRAAPLRWRRDARRAGPHGPAPMPRGATTGRGDDMMAVR